MLCPNCGAETIEGKPFCQNCGNRLEQQPIAAPAQEQQPAAAYPYQQDVAAVAPAAAATANPYGSAQPAAQQQAAPVSPYAQAQDIAPTGSVQQANPYATAQGQAPVSPYAQPQSPASPYAGQQSVSQYAGGQATYGQQQPMSSFQQNQAGAPYPPYQSSNAFQQPQVAPAQAGAKGGSGVKIAIIAVVLIAVAVLAVFLIRSFACSSTSGSGSADSAAAASGEAQSASTPLFYSFIVGSADEAADALESYAEGEYAGKTVIGSSQDFIDDISDLQMNAQDDAKAADSLREYSGSWIGILYEDSTTEVTKKKVNKGSDPVGGDFILIVDDSKFDSEKLAAIATEYFGCERVAIGMNGTRMEGFASSDEVAVSLSASQGSGEAEGIWAIEIEAFAIDEFDGADDAMKTLDKFIDEFDESEWDDSYVAN